MTPHPLTRLARLSGPAAVAALVWPTASASSFSEPPAVLYGKVLQHGGGVAYQLYEGLLEVVLVNDDDPDNRVALSARLREVGDGGEHSYRLELPLKHLPAQQDLEEHLEVGRNQSSFRFESITVDGEPAAPLDPARATFATAFALRAAEHRLDLRVSLEEADADGDGMPDWWEDRYALNRHTPSDATTDADGDGLSNLDEFRGGTDPTVANTEPLVRTRELVFPVGGTSGVALSVVDVDSDPSETALEITSAPEGVTLYRAGQAMAAGQTFTYADVLAGRVAAEVARGFGGGTLGLEVSDTLTGSSHEVAVTITAFSPWTGKGLRPLAWLVADGLGDGPVSEWGDLSGHGRDAFQPASISQPVATGGAVDFHGTDYLFLDTKGDELTGFSAFAVFGLVAHHADAQTLLRTSEAAVEVAGSAAGPRARTLVVKQPDRTVVGPPVTAGEQPVLVAAVGAEEGSFLSVPGGGHFPSAPGGNALPHVFATLGGSREISAAAADAFLDGSLSELVLYSEALEPAALSRVQDYQRARWTGAEVWDYRDETAPVTLTAAPGGIPNLLNGGWANDTLNGGPGPDVLRGGAGDDTHTGGAGADRFFFSTDPGSADVVTDFSPGEGDVLDFSDIFWDKAGDPAAYVGLRSEVVPGGVDGPLVSTLVELDYEGDGGGADQIVRLEGVALSDTGLVGLMAGRALVLGGPRFQTGVTLAAHETNFPALPVARAIEVRRSGVTDGEALEVPLAFGGTVAIDGGFRVDGAGGTGPVRTVAFAAGETSRTVTVTPLGAAGEIVVDVLEHPDFAAAEPLRLTVVEGLSVSVAAVEHAGVSAGQPGVVRVSRSGELEEALTLGLTFGGSAENGTTYEQLPDALTLAPGQASAELRLVPLPAASGALTAGGGFPVARVTVVPEPARFALPGGGAAEVVFYDTAPGGTETFAAWRLREFPGDNDPALGSRDDDGDTVTNHWEYVYGTDPHRWESPAESAAEVRVTGGHLEVTLVTTPVLTDVQVHLEETGDLAAWSPAATMVPHVEPSDTPGADQVRRVYRSTAPLDADDGAVRSGSFRFRLFEPRLQNEP